MPRPSIETGRALLFVVLAVVVAAVVAMFLVADPFGAVDAVDRADETDEAGDLRSEEAGADPAADLENAGSGLAGRYGAGDLGAVRMRLLHVADRRPLADQAVRLVPRTGGGRAEASDGAGVVEFPNVAPSRGYRVEIEGEDVAHVSIQGVNVRRGETTDLGDILLGANVVLRGRVVDATGRPLPGTSVSVYTPNRGMLSEGIIFNMVDQATNFPAPVEQALTDEQGWFTLVALKDGSYRLEARHGGFATRYENDVVVSEERPARDMTIVLGEGASVEGKVLDEGGKPVVGARVVALKDMGRRFFGSTTLERDVALTDASGAYALDTLTIGTTYRFGVIAEGYAPIFEMSGTELMDKVQKKDFSLVLGGTIVGRVTRKDNGEPVAGARIVTAVGRMFGGRGGRGGGEPQNAGTGRATTGEDGSFRIENLMPGPVMSGQVKAPGYVTYTASMWTGNGWPDVEAGGVIEVAVELEPGGSVGGTVTDARTNEPIPYAQVTVLPRGNPMRAMFTGSPTAEADGQGRYTVSGVQPGEYGVIAIAPGYAASDANADDTKVTIPEEGGLVSRDVALQAAGVVTGVVRDTKGEPIAGARVRTRLAPQPRSEGGGRGGFRGGRRMAGMLPGGSGADLSDQQGRFVIEDVSSEQRWILEAEADDFVATESEPFTVAPGDTKEQDLVLSGGGTLEGRVVDDRGGFVSGVRVQVGHLPAERATQRLSAWEVDRWLDPRVLFTDEDGKFRAENLRPGITVVKAEREGFVTFYKRNVVMRADEVVDGYTVSMTRGDVMEGKVFGSTGRPLAGAMVAVTKRAPGDEGEEAEAADEEIEPRLMARTDESGHFEIENIPPGMYSVVVWFAQGHQGWARERNEKAIRRNVSSDASTIEFRLEAAAEGQGGFGPGARGRRGGNGGGSDR